MDVQVQVHDEEDDVSIGGSDDVEVLIHEDGDPMGKTTIEVKAATEIKEGEDGISLEGAEGQALPKDDPRTELEVHGILSDEERAALRGTPAAGAV